MKIQADAQEARRYRDAVGCGIEDAKLFLEKQQAEAALKQIAEGPHDPRLLAVLAWLVKRK